MGQTDLRAAGLLLVNDKTSTLGELFWLDDTPQRNSVATVRNERVWAISAEMTPLALVAERARERLPGADVLLKAVAPVGGRRKLLVVFARVQSGFRAVDGLDTGRSGFVSEFVQRFQ